jgi:hypothetical protein
MTVPNSPLKYLQQNMHLGRIYPLPGYKPLSVNPSQQQSSPKQDDILYKLLLAEREETARVKKVIKQIEEEDEIHNLLLSERKKKRQLRDKQHYVDREKIQMKERELMKEMEKVREARDKLQIENREREHHFDQLSPWNLPVGQAKEQFDKKLQKEISLDIVCNGGTDTSSVERTNNPETKSITSSMVSERRNMTKYVCNSIRHNQFFLQQRHAHTWN